MRGYGLGEKVMVTLEAPKKYFKPLIQWYVITMSLLLLSVFLFIVVVQYALNLI